MHKCLQRLFHSTPITEDLMPTTGLHKYQAHIRSAHTYTQNSHTHRQIFVMKKRKTAVKSALLHDPQ